MSVVKVERFGDVTGIALDAATLQRLGVVAGDALIVSETPGGVVLTPDAEAPRDDVLKRGRDFIERYRRTFQALAE